MQAHPQQMQPTSGLRALKRSWSGNAHDLGETGQDEVIVAPTKAQRRMQTSGPMVPSDTVSSSPGSILEGWDPTPPERQAAIRAELLKREDEQAQRGNIAHVFKPKITHMEDMDSRYPESSHASSSQMPGARVSGLSRSSTFSRTPSNEHGRTIGDSTTSRSQSKPYDAHHRSTSSSSRPPLKTLDDAEVAPQAQSRSEKPRDLPQGFKPLSKQQLLEKRRRAELERQQSESGTSKLKSPAEEYKEKEEKVPGMFRLSQQQLHVRNLVVQEGKSVFFTGSAGTGKSVLLRDIIKLLKQKFERDAVAVTASTGIAACNIGGVTLHSFAGIGLGVEDMAVLIRKIRRNKKAMNRWHRTSVLIIDEISMVEPALLDKLDGIARALRKKPNHPFGGIQLVITGDFFQLPPVMKSGTRFAFESKMWDEALSHKVNLTQVFRQKDETFVRMLNEMRHGQLSTDSIQRFQRLNRPPKIDDEFMVPTELFPLREDVDKSNGMRLAGLKVSGHTFEAKDGGELPVEQREKVLSQFMAPPKIFLKEGAQVMLIKNTDETLVNGSIGTVVGFSTPHQFKMASNALPNLYEDRHLQKMKEMQKEWTFRESSPEKGAINGGANGSGSGRSTPVPGGRGTPQPDAGMLDSKQRKVMGISGMGGRQFPVVRFATPGGGYRTELIKPEEWKNELPNGEVQAFRIQLPLILAWAMSIHKSQGQTIPFCKIDLGKVFEKGQAYVALSRATSLEGLQVLNFSAHKVMAHPRVIEWSKSLATMSVG